MANTTVESTKLVRGGPMRVFIECSLGGITFRGSFGGCGGGGPFQRDLTKDSLGEGDYCVTAQVLYWDGCVLKMWYSKRLL